LPEKEPFNEAAVAGAHKTPHDRTAHAAAGGAGGLYRFQGGALDPGDASAAAWLGKPDGMGYAAFEARLRGWTDGARVGLWRRQMVLGPAPEFCLLAPLAHHEQGRRQCRPDVGQGVLDAGRRIFWDVSLKVTRSGCGPLR